jgi:hypothetical protein
VNFKAMLYCSITFVEESGQAISHILRNLWRQCDICREIWGDVITCKTMEILLRNSTFVGEYWEVNMLHLLENMGRQYKYANNITYEEEYGR